MTDITQCPTCDRPIEENESAAIDAVKEHMGIPVEDTLTEEEVPVEEPEELSDLEELEQLIETLETQLSGGFNLWLADRIAKLKKFADGDNFDSDGNRIDSKVPEREVVLHQFSPPEATNLEGWWEAPMGEIGDLPRSMVREIQKLGFRNEIAFKKETLGLSKARSNGCFVVRNQRETANYFLNHTEEAARKTGTTTRIIAMMGHALDQWSYMLPMYDFYGANEKRVKAAGVGHFALDPEVPFTDEEKDIYKWMGLMAQTSGFASAIVGMKDKTMGVLANPEERYKAPYVNGRKEGESIPVAKPNHHRIWWVINHPWWVIPRMIMKFNTAEFKYSLWRTMCYKANRIDYGYAAPVPGWVPREDIAPVDKSVNQLMGARKDLGRNSKIWDEANGENTAAYSETKPLFVAGSELERDGTPKEYSRW